MLFINPEIGEEWNRTVLSESVDENAPELIKEIKTHIPKHIPISLVPRRLKMRSQSWWLLYSVGARRPTCCFRSWAMPSMTWLGECRSGSSGQGWADSPGPSICALASAKERKSRCEWPSKWPITPQPGFLQVILPPSSHCGCTLRVPACNWLLCRCSTIFCGAQIALHPLSPVPPPLPSYHVGTQALLGEEGE